MSAHRTIRTASILGALLAGLGIVPSTHAAVPLISGYGGTVGYGTDCLSPNDDGSSEAIDLTPAFPSGLRFFTNVHTTAYVNTNGNITFSGPLSTFTPNPFPVASQPMIAPYWGDVDIRNVGGTCQSGACTNGVCSPCQNPTENGVWWHLEPGRMVVTWDRVGYFACHNDLRMNFQLILTAAGCGGAGDFDVEFRFNQCGWETGDASNGSGGFGGTQAQAGFDAGNSVDFVAIAGSMAAGISTALCFGSNVGESGIWRFQIRSGSVVCPDAGQTCDTGLLGVCASGRTNCVGSGIECVRDVTASTEVCDALDNDCDGTVDEDDDGSLCPGSQVCAQGTCMPPCFESVCSDGQVCNEAGICVDTACQTMSCPAGERCRAGQCVGACTGVTCPTGRTCRAGRCIDLCGGLTCDDCTVCEAGTCATKCEFAACSSTETCQADGRCLENGCVGVVCETGYHCVAGNCMDSCAGAVCPENQQCVAGECRSATQPTVDAGTVVGVDAGTGPGVTPGSGFSSGCGCRVAQGGGQAPSAGQLGQLGLLGLALLLTRRRGRGR